MSYSSNRSTGNTGNRRAKTGGDGAKMRSTPTENMLGYAGKIADALDMDLPEGVEDSFDACREFIDEYAPQVPPTDKQVKFAETLAKDAGERIPREVLASKLRLSEWIDAHSGGDEA